MPQGRGERKAGKTEGRQDRRKGRGGTAAQGKSAEALGQVEDKAQQRGDSTENKRSVSGTESCLCSLGPRGGGGGLGTAVHHQPGQKDTKAPKEGLLLSMVGASLRAKTLSHLFTAVSPAPGT